MTRQVGRLFQFSLLGVVASGFLALAGSGYLDRPTLVLTCLGLLWRGLAIAGMTRIRPSARQATWAALFYLALLPLDYYLISRDFLAAVVHGVCFLAVTRVLTAETQRDYAFTGLISFVELIAAAILSDQPGFIAWLSLYIVFAVAALTSAEIHRRLAEAERRKLYVESPVGGRLTARVMGIACGATVAVAAMTVGLFFLVPRTARVTARYVPGGERMTGFSNSVDLGGWGAISKDNRPVMHVRSYGRALPADAKWRGAAMSRFDGRRWSEPAALATEIPAAPGIAVVADRMQLSRRDGPRLLYSVDVMSAGTGHLFLTGIPEFINIDLRAILATRAGAFRAMVSPREPLRYQVSAFAGPALGEPVPAAERARNLQFPALDTRILALAREWAGEGEAGERAQRIETHLRRDFRYALDGPEGRVNDPLADFLFVRKEGYCEYFASAMAVMLRSVGIPARVATGFTGGFYNPVTKQLVVRASDAHAWVEALIPGPPGPNGGGEAWRTFDPTPAAPEGAAVSRFSMYMEAADDLWRDWVLSYDLTHQAAAVAGFEAAWRATVTSLSSSRARVWGAAETAGGVVAGIALLWLLLRFGIPAFGRRAVRARIAGSRGSPGDAGRLYEQLLGKLARRGFTRSAAETPMEFAEGLPAAERRLVEQFTGVYNAVRFGGDTAGMARLAALLREFDAEKRSDAVSGGL